MKLDFANNIRRLRLAKDLTQDSLAEELGVSVQTVSRWEGNSKPSYPDIELLPVIAEFFSVTVDELLGCSKAQSEERLERMWEEVEELVNLRRPSEEIVPLLERMHEEYPRDMVVMCNLCSEISCCPELMNDPHYVNLARELAEYVTENSTKKHLREGVAHSIIMIETEDRLPEALEKYSSTWDASAPYMLEYRYLRRGDGREKYAEAFQKNRAYYIEQLLNSNAFPRRYFFPEESIFPENPKFIYKMELDLIDTVCGYETVNPVIGDGVADLWSGERIENGILLAREIASEGDLDRALTMLEDAAALAEVVAALENGTSLTYRSPFLDRLSATVKKEEIEATGSTLILAHVGARNGAGLYFDTDRYMDFLTTEPRHGKGFDSLKDDSRFAAVVARFEKIRNMR